MPYGIAEMKARSKTRIITRTEHICANAVDGFLLRCGLLPCQAVAGILDPLLQDGERLVAEGDAVTLERDPRLQDQVLQPSFVRDGFVGEVPGLDLQIAASFSR